MAGGAARRTKTLWVLWFLFSINYFRKKKNKKMVTIYNYIVRITHMMTDTTLDTCTVNRHVLVLILRVPLLVY